MYFTAAGFGPFADKKGEWWADIHGSEPTVAEDGKTVVSFRTYSYWNEVKTPSIYVGPSKNGKPGHVGLYLSEDKK